MQSVIETIHLSALRVVKVMMSFFTLHFVVFHNFKISFLNAHDDIKYEPQMTLTLLTAYSTLYRVTVRDECAAVCC